MEGNLRIFSARLNTEIPSRAPRFDAVALEHRKRLQQPGPAARQAKPIGARRPEQARAEPNRDRQPRRTQANSLTGVHRRHAEFLSLRLVGPASGQRNCRRGPLFENPTEIFHRVAGYIERSEVQVVLGRSGNPRLV